MFQGFTPETFDFLWGIRMNNNRDWFQANKPIYQKHLYEPMKALGQELFQPFLEETGSVLKVSRIYRDARMHHPLPYKESLWICIRKDVQWWAENPCLYFEIRPEGISYGFFYWKPRTAVLEAFRKDITARKAEFLSMLRQVEKATGQQVVANLYKRPKPTDDPELMPFFAWKEAFSLERQEDFGPEVFTPALARRVKDFFIQLMPLYDYFNRFTPQ